MASSKDRTIVKFSSIAAAALLVLAITACSSNGPMPKTGASTPITGSNHRHGVPVHFSIRIPKKQHLKRHKRGAHYVSTATQSMSIDVASSDGGGPVGLQQVGLTAASNGCSSSLASTLCQLTLPLVPGFTYDLTVATYDGPLTGGNVSGNLLSGGQNVGLFVTPGYDERNDTIYAPTTLPAGITPGPWLYAFDGNGNARTLTGSAGLGPFSDINGPSADLADPYNGRIYLANASGNTVEAYDDQGTPAGLIIASVNFPIGITLVP
jgi:hypothetical protein